MDPQQQFKDYYYVLGVSPDATTEEIRDAYDDLYEKYGPHVSVSGRDPETVIRAFKDITEAYDTLTNPTKRREYDLNNLPHLQKSNDLRALWGKITGTDLTKEAPMRGEAVDTQVEVEVSLREAYKGTSRTLRLEEQMPCQNCINVKPVSRLQCAQCRGTAYQLVYRDEKVALPPGLYDKKQHRLEGKGKYDSRCQKNGDLVLNIKLARHQFFTIIDRDVACTLPVTFLEAILGGEVDCPTPTGRVVMKLQPLTQSGRIYRLKGLGLAGADFLVTIEVTVPKQISAEEVVLFRKLKEASTLENPRDAIFKTLKPGE